MTELVIGDEAPDFSLPAGGDKTATVSGFRGKAVVLYFYPKDDTSACTAQAIAFTQFLPEFKELGAAVLGISPDSVKKHDSFAKKRELTVPLASDEGAQVAQLYGVWKEKSMYGRTYMGIERATLLIDGDGVINRIWPKVKVAGHVEEVLRAVRELIAR